MIKPSVTQHLSEKEKKGAIEAALKGGMEPAEVFKAVLQNVYGVSQRKKMVVDWGKKMGLEPSEALRIAQNANLISSVRKPHEPGQEKPPRKTAGKSGE
jgi:hypothetical protein